MQKHHNDSGVRTKYFILDSKDLVTLETINIW